MQLTLEYPSWYLVFCLVAGLGFAGVLYYREKTFSDRPAWVRTFMAALRFLSAALLVFFLLSPVLRAVQRESRKPILIIAQDASESVGNTLKGKDREAYLGQLQRLGGDLGRDFDVRYYAFGSSVREGLDTAFRDKASDLAGFLRYASDTYSGQNVGAVLLASDGIYNQGTNPVYVKSALNAPLITVALGDTVPKKDLVLKRVFNNKIAYLGDRFSVLADIAATNCAGASTTLSVYRIDGKNSILLQQFPVPIGGNDFFRTVDISLEASKSGVQRYRLVLGRISGEVGTANNTREIFVEVLDARQKILILAGGPHPDISAVKQSLELNKNYQVENALIGEFSGNISDYDFVVFVQLPNKTANLNNLIETMNRKGIPRFFIAGLQTDFQQLNRLQNLVAVRADSRSSNDVQAALPATFNLFVPDEGFRSKIPDYPPLTAPFGEFAAGAQAQVFMYQRIRKIETNYPLIAFGEANGIRTGIITGEGLWRWRLFNYLQEENHDFFDNLMSKFVQFLSVKDDKRKFRVNPAKNIFDENEAIILDAELYNKAFELVNEPEARIVISNENNKDFTFTFNKTGQSYSLNAGSFPVGSYRYKAYVNQGGEKLEAEGRFSVQPIELELYATTANHGLLNSLSAQSGGRMLSPGEVSELAGNLRESPYAKPVIYETASTNALINYRWIFALLILVLTTEWFMRRYFGAY
jgi:hypothetical protein